jgi:hypothetical protein
MIPARETIEKSLSIEQPACSRDGDNDFQDFNRRAGWNN